MISGLCLSRGTRWFCLLVVKVKFFVFVLCLVVFMLSRRISRDVESVTNWPTRSTVFCECKLLHYQVLVRKVTLTKMDKGKQALTTACSH